MIIRSVTRHRNFLIFSTTRWRNDQEMSNRLLFNEGISNHGTVRKFKG